MNRNQPPVPPESTPGTDQHAPEPVHSDDNSAAGEEDPGAALDLPPAPAPIKPPR